MYTRNYRALHMTCRQIYIYCGQELRMRSLILIKRPLFGGPPVSPGPYAPAYPADPDATPLHLRMFNENLINLRLFGLVQPEIQVLIQELSQ